jgi:Phage integrase family
MIAAPPPPGFHVNLGDLPTWLGVAAASFAAVFVYLQLRSQQREFARQVAALQRLQADDVDVVPERIQARGMLAPDGRSQFYWALEVSNGSRRPIRDVAAKIEPAKGADLEDPLKAGFPGLNGLISWGDFTVARLVRSKVKCGFVFAPPKGGKDREVPLPDAVGLRLSAHIAAYPPMAVELPWRTLDATPDTARLLFTTVQGKAITRTPFVQKHWHPALRKAGVPVARENGFHALRHHFASALLYDGVDIRALAANLGHHDPAFTLRVYAHLLPDAADRMRSVINRAAAAEADGPETAQGAAQ